MCHLSEEPHEEECLDKHQQCEDDKNTSSNLELFISWVIWNVHNNVDQASPHMALIKVIPLVAEINSKPLFLQLGHVIYERVNKAKQVEELKRILKHYPAWNILVDILLHDEEREDQEVAHMRLEAHHVDNFSVRIPFEVKQIIQCLCFKDGKLF